MPSPANSHKGGPAYHKAGCSCYACGGKKKALTFTTGGGGEVMVPVKEDKKPVPKALNADFVIETKGRTRRDRVAEWVLYRSQDPTLTNIEIAAKLGISPKALNSYISDATREGWLKFNSPEERLEHELKPMIVDNIKHFLVEKDRLVTIEAAKGTGLFKSHQAVKVEGNTPTTVLALKIETVDGGQGKVVEGNVVGRPMELKE